MGQREISLLQQAIDAGDLARVRALVEERPDRLRDQFEHRDRRDRIRRSTPLQYALQPGNTEILRVLIDAGADVHELDSALFGCCEGHNLEQMRQLVGLGVDPNDAYNDGWDCHVLYGLLQTYTRSTPEHLHACVELLIEAGANFEDGPVMDMHRGRLDRLEARLRQEPELVHRHFQLDYGDHLTLRGATLLHVAAEYGEIECIDLLLRHGADLNAPCAMGANDVGGQTPLFHAIGSNQGSCFTTFEHLLSKGPDLLVRACVQRNDADDGKVMDCVHKNRDHHFEEVWTLTPLGYALRYEEGPGYRAAGREAARLRELGAPEE